MTKTLQTAIDTYAIITTADGHMALFSKKYNEATHSTAGAIEETTYNYLEGSAVLTSINKQNFSILELGFGFGIGLLASVQYFSQNKFTNHIEYYGLEIDKDLILMGVTEYLPRHLKNLNAEITNFNDIIDSKTLLNLIKFEIKLSDLNFLNFNLKVTIIVGDALKTLPIYHQHYPLMIDHIYQDAYGPKIFRELWSFEWFVILKSVSNINCILSTFSSSSGVRKAMVLAGWRIFQRAGYKNKKTSTIAKLIGEMTPEMLDHLNRSPIDAITLENLGR